MSTQGSVTLLLKAVERGDELAAQRLWERYYAQLLRIARAKMTGVASRAFDEQDVVLNAFEACYRGLQVGRYPNINDRHDLWRLLISLTSRKTIDGIRREQRQKRGGGQVLLEADMGRPGHDSNDGRLADFEGAEPTPEFAAMLAEDLKLRLDSLPSDVLREICLWKIEGFTNEEIAAKLKCTTRTVERKLELIRKQWTEAEADVGPAEESTM